MATKTTRNVSHTHVQSVAAATWEIKHGLACRPAVSVSIMHQGKRQVILPREVEIVDLETVRVVFSNPQTGEARLT